MTPEPSPAATRTGPARHKVLLFTATLAVITYLDRVCIAQAAPLIARDLALGPKEMGWIFAAFGIPYALGEIPGGWLGDRFGPRRILTKVVVWWSIFTAATGAAWNFLSLVVCRALFGLGEAGCFPNITKVFSIWMPSHERVRAQGLLWLAARWGGAFTPLLVTALLAWLNWRLIFLLFGLAGVAWAVWFWRWFRDDPAQHPGVSARELALLDGAQRNAPSPAPLPWRQLGRSRTVWLLWLQYFCMSYGWYFYITWLPTYLHDARGLTLAKSALLSGLPLFVGGIGCFAGGWLARRLAARTGQVGRARRIVACTGLFSAAAMLLVSTRITEPALAVMAIACASFANDLAMAPDWAACMDIGGRWAGSLSGSMNMMGNLGGAVGPVVVGYILEAHSAGPAGPTAEAWMLTFSLAAGVYVVGAIAWLFIDPVSPLEPLPTAAA